MVGTLGVGMGFKENIRQLRTARGWSQDRTAREVGVPVRTYTNWELGEREPRMMAIVMLSRAFGVTADELLAGEEPPAEDPAPEPPAPKKGKKK